MKKFNNLFLVYSVIYLKYVKKVKKESSLVPAKAELDKALASMDQAALRKDIERYTKKRVDVKVEDMNQAAAETRPDPATMRGVIPYIVLEFALLMVMVGVPEIATWLPSVIVG